MTAPLVDTFFEVEEDWWRPLRLRHDRRISSRDPNLGFIPTEIQIALLRNKIVANKAWAGDVLEWLRDETTDLFYVGDRWVMFASTDDMTLFVLKFEASNGN